jgi:hypothetical protein
VHILAILYVLFPLYFFGCNPDIKIIQICFPAEPVRQFDAIISARVTRLFLKRAALRSPVMCSAPAGQF